MKKLTALLLTVAIFNSSCGSLNTTQITKAAEEILNGMNGGGNVTQTEIIAGLKEALTVGIGNGADLVSKTDGYFKNATIKIPLPPEAQKVENTLRDIGLSKEVDRAIESINRGAEDAAKSAKPIFVNAIKQMTFQDAMAILKNDNKQAATDFLKKATTTQLQAAFKPVIQKSLEKTLATKYYGDIVKEYNKVPLIKNKLNPDLSDFATQKALDGLFFMVAKEEEKIRVNPVARVTELLKKVFALQDPGNKNNNTTKPSSTTPSTTPGTVKPKPKVKSSGGN
ncbi:MAG: DUF4197 domain-containing protein [Chitinophagales bacterium]|jgi:hypothetical protein|nr:DUF4197 domain-containing protein [Chitinophagales bacterium]HNL07991.1 DUF4197 domain-containing protein [Chitinophagales bacterium]